MRAALTVLTLVCTGALAAPASASGVCDPERPAAVEDEAIAAAEDTETADVILPCAIAESGLLGPACQDAPMYVVTHGGVVLCQVNLAVVAPGTSTPIVSSRPAVPAPHPSSLWQQPALPSGTPLLPAVAVTSAPRAPRVPLAIPADVPPVPPWGPS